MYLQETDEQKEVIAFRDGPAIVLAIAGSGKTTTTLLRIDALIRSGASPGEILLTTFSRLGAADMKKRAAKLGVKKGVEYRTLHSYAWGILRTASRKKKLAPSWFPRAVVRDAVKTYAEVEGLSDNEKPRTKDVLGEIGVAKSSLILPGEWTSSGGEVFPAYREWALDRGRSGVFADVVDYCYRQLERARKSPFDTGWDRLKGFVPGDEALDHDDAILEVARGILRGEDWLQGFEGRFSYVIVDEAQDNNRGQWELVKFLSRTFENEVGGETVSWKNLMAVGDDSQAIYAWRGAQPSLLYDYMVENGPFLNFFRLTTNFRSGEEILTRANGILDSIQGRLFDGKLRLGRPGVRGEVTYKAYRSAREEADDVVDWIKASNKSGRKFSDIAVLYRINATAGLVEMAMIREKIPYRVAGKSFFKRPDVVAILAYLTLAVDWSDREAFELVYRVPLKGLGREFLKRFPTYASIVRSNNRELTSRWAHGANKLMAAVSAVEHMIGQGPAGVAKAIRFVFDQSGVREHFAQDADSVGGGAGEGDNELVDDEQEEAIETLCQCAMAVESVEELLRFAEDMSNPGGIGKQDDEGNRIEDQRVTLSTVHRCVAPDTIVETESGLHEIRSIADSGWIATADGPRRFDSFVQNQPQTMLRITTKSGYEVTVTPDHGLMAWNGSDYRMTQAEDIRVGQFLRLKLGSTVATRACPPLPEAPPQDTRATLYRVPVAVDEDLAEFLGLMVGDGNVFNRGFRLGKQHHEVARRFGELAAKIFGATPAFFERKNRRPGYGLASDTMLYCEVRSTQLVGWLRLLGGLDAHRKAIPTCILSASLECQARFLRGLFEDGTVNVKNSRLDHFDWSTKHPEMARLVQVMLLRLGIISSRKPVAVAGRTQWHVYVFGRNAHTLRDRVGLISDVKRARLELPTGEESMYSVPLSKDRVKANFDRGTSLYAYQNGMWRGYLSRHTLRVHGGFGAELSFHHDRVTRVERLASESMCVRVPDGGRFLQNGFDGSNCKGLEFEEVFLIGLAQGLFPLSSSPIRDELRLGYVAYTRAKDVLHLSCSSGNDEPPTPSVLLELSGVVPQTELSLSLLGRLKAQAAARQESGQVETEKTPAATLEDDDDLLAVDFADADRGQPVVAASKAEGTRVVERSFWSVLPDEDDDLPF